MSDPLAASTVLALAGIVAALIYFLLTSRGP